MPFSRHATLPSLFRGLSSHYLARISRCVQDYASDPGELRSLSFFLMLRSSALSVLSFRAPGACSMAPRVSCTDNGRILLANPEISFYCTNIRLLIDENKINYMMLAGQECMSAQTSATRPFFLPIYYNNYFCSIKYVKAGQFSKGCSHGEDARISGGLQAATCAWMERGRQARGRRNGRYASAPVGARRATRQCGRY